MNIKFKSNYLLLILLLIVSVFTIVCCKTTRQTSKSNNTNNDTIMTVAISEIKQDTISENEIQNKAQENPTELVLKNGDTIPLYKSFDPNNDGISCMVYKANDVPEIIKTLFPKVEFYYESFSNSKNLLIYYDGLRWYNTNFNILLKEMEHNQEFDLKSKFIAYMTLVYGFESKIQIESIIETSKTIMFYNKERLYNYEINATFDTPKFKGYYTHYTNYINNQIIEIMCYKNNQTCGIGILKQSK